MQFVCDGFDVAGGEGIVVVEGEEHAPAVIVLQFAARFRDFGILDHFVLVTEDQGDLVVPLYPLPGIN